MTKHLFYSFNFVKFLLAFLFSKKAVYFFLVIPFLLTLILAFIPAMANSTDSSQIAILLIAPIFASLIITVLHSVYISIVIFKDSESNGLDLIVASKPIEKIDVVIAKYIFLFIYSLLQAVLILIAIAFGSIYFAQYTSSLFTSYLITGSFFVPWFGFLFFGLITGLLAKKMNRPVAYLFATTIFLPLLLLGNFTGYFSEPTISSFNKTINNINTENSNSLPVYEFSNSNSSDQFYLVPSNIRASFDEGQISQISNAFSSTENTAFFSQLLSWIDIPYQMGIAYSENGYDYLNTNSNVLSSQLSNILNYDNTSNMRYKYSLVSNSGLSNKLGDLTLVPNAPLLNEQAGLNNTNKAIIFAWENAETNQAISEDDFSFSNIDYFAGRLEWDNIQTGLKDQTLINLINTFNNEQSQISELTRATYLDNLYTQINLWLENNSASSYFESLNLDTDFETYQKQLYLYIITLYQTFFSQNSEILNLILPTEDTLENQQYLVKVDINSEVRNYYLGGYLTFEKVSTIINTTNEDGTTTSSTVARIQLEKSDDYVFKPVANYFSIERSQIVTPSYGIAIFWISFILILSTGVFFVYYKREQ